MFYSFLTPRPPPLMRCENCVSVNGCLESKCLNRATCEVDANSNKSYTCFCRDHYYGEFCQYGELAPVNSASVSNA